MEKLRGLLWHPVPDWPSPLEESESSGWDTSGGETSCRINKCLKETAGYKLWESDKVLSAV